MNDGIPALSLYRALGYAVEGGEFRFVVGIFSVALRGSLTQAKFAKSSNVDARLRGLEFAEFDQRPGGLLRAGVGAGLFDGVGREAVETPERPGGCGHAVDENGLVAVGGSEVGGLRRIRSGARWAGCTWRIFRYAP